MTSNVHPFTKTPRERMLRIGPWVFEPEACRLYRGPDEQRLTPKTSAVLEELARAAGTVVTREALFDRVWPHAEPSADLLNHAIKELRRVLGDDLKSPTFIETIPKVGYRMIAPVQALDPATPRGAAVIDFPRAGHAPHEPDPPRVPAMLVLVLLVLAGLVIAVPLAQQKRNSVAGKATQLSDVHFVTAEPGEEAWPRLSPDGGFMAYTAPSELNRLRLNVRAVDGTKPIRVTREVGGTPYHEHFPVWSPDGASIAFLRVRDDGECRVNVVSALGGVERTVYECRPFVVDYFDWTPDGRHLVVSKQPDKPRGAPIRVTLLDIASGGVKTLDYGPTSTEHDIDPRVSPDGRWIAFRRGVAPFSDLYVMSIAGGTARRVTQLGSTIRGHDWMPDGRSLLFSSDHDGEQSLYTLDLESLAIETLGEEGSHFPDVATRRDRVLFQRLASETHIVEFPVEPGADKRDVIRSTASDMSAQFAPNDERIAFISTRSGQPAVWLHDPSSDATRLIAKPDRGFVVRPRWSPDGTRVTFTARQGVEAVVYVVEVRSGQLQRINPPGTSGRYGNFTPDGTGILYSEEASDGWHVVRRTLEGNVREEYPGSLGGSDPVMSPDGKSIYYTKVSVDGLFRLDLASRQERLVTKDIAYRNMDSWLLVGDHIWYLANSGPRTGLFRLPVAGGEPERVRVVFSPLGDSSLSLSPDRTRMLLTERGRDDSDLVLAEIDRAVP